LRGRNLLTENHFLGAIRAGASVQLLIGQGDYVLPFSKERGLTEVLAFLAKTKDGWDHIPAVCVEQNSSGIIFNVILAINKSTYADAGEIHIHHVGPVQIMSPFVPYASCISRTYTFMGPLFALRNYMLFSDLDEKHSSGSSFDSIIVITGLWRKHSHWDNAARQLLIWRKKV
jgi:hypothetical protein